MSRIVERFEAAVEALVGDGPVKSRLRKAYCEHLEDLQQVELPINGQGDFGQLHLALHSVQPFGKVDCVKASVQKMSTTEAWWHARTIVRLYSELIALEQGSRLEPEIALQSTEAEEPPRFLVSGN